MLGRNQITCGGAIRGGEDSCTGVVGKDAAAIDDDDWKVKPRGCFFVAVSVFVYKSSLEIKVASSIIRKYVTIYIPSR